MKGGVTRHRKGGPWYAWRYDAAAGAWKRRSTGVRTKGEASRIATAWLAEGEAMELGRQPATDWASMPIEQHIGDYMDQKRDSERSVGRHHLDGTRRLLLDIVKAAGWTGIGQVTQDGLLAAIARMQSSRAAVAVRRAEVLERRAAAQGELDRLEAAGQPRPRELRRAAKEPCPPRREALQISRASLNHYRAAWKAFTRWAHKRGRLPADVLADLGRWTQRGFETFHRRSLAAEELQSLFDAARRGPVRNGVPGPDREMLYRVALGTGFRRGELASLRVVDLVLRPAAPRRAHVVLAAGSSKNRKAVEQPLPGYLVGMLERWVAGRDPMAPLWPDFGMASAEMLQADLADAQIAVVDARGRKLDFHALRHTFGTLLARAGVSPQECQRLMRHSDPKLTMLLYTHIEEAELGSAVDRLPESSLQRLGVATARSRSAAVPMVGRSGAECGSDEATQQSPESQAPTTEGDRVDEVRTSGAECEWAGRDSNPRRGDYESGSGDSESLADTRLAQRGDHGAADSEQCAGSSVARAAVDDCDGGDSGSGQAVAAPTAGREAGPARRRSHARDRADAGLAPDIDLAFRRIGELAAMARPTAPAGGGR